jgi:hypothetical protein
MSTDGYVTVVELAEIMRVDPAVVRYHARAGALRDVAEKIGRDWMIPAAPAAQFAATYEPYGTLRGPRSPERA